ncbi:hypothetical protein, partial [Pseudomonas aeruginosa]|uniref:hypothetical protein n=1 Tax=Pseudomonas aeruginosa TaxID=287 RepID=UPI003D335DD5
YGAFFGDKNHKAFSRFCLCGHEKSGLVEAMAGLQGVSPPFLRFPEALARMIAFVFSGIKMFPLTSSRIDSLVARTHYSCNKLNHILGYVPSRDITKEISEVILDKEGRR